MPALLASYAIEHFFLSTLLLLIAAAVVRTIPAHARHRWLLGALLIAVLGPLLPYAGIVPGGAPTALPPDGMPAGAAGGGIGFDPAFAAALLALWAMVGAWRLHRLFAAWRSASTLSRLSPRSLPIERDHADLLPPGTRVHLSTSFGPAVLGVLHPCIVLPAQLAGQLPREAMRAVLAHEAEHIVRRDPAWHALQHVALAVFWWNPALARLAKWLDQARELACDAGAVRRAGDRVQYAEALLCVAELPRGDHAPRMLTALAMANATPLLEHRIDALLEPARHRRGTRSTLGALLVLAMVLAWAAASTAAPVVRTTASAKPGDSAHSEYERLSPSAESEHERLSRSAQIAHEQLSQAAQSGYEQLSQAAQSKYEQLSQSAQSEYEQLSQSAQSKYEQLSQSAQLDYEQSAAAAERRLNQAQEPSL